MGKQLLSHRYNLLPLLRSRPGGVQKELIVKDLPGTNVAIHTNLQKLISQFLRSLSHRSGKVLMLKILCCKIILCEITIFNVADQLF